MGTEPHDEELVERAQGGERKALVKLYRKYVGEINGYLRHQLGDAPEADDVTSETFLRMVQALDTYRGNASFRTWLYAIARNQLRDHWRRNGRRPQTTPLDPTRPPAGATIGREGAASSASASTTGNPRATELGRAILARLPENYREVLELRIMDGRSIRDTAEELGLSVSNVKVLQHRGLKAASNIASELEAPPPDPTDEPAEQDDEQ